MSETDPGLWAELNGHRSRQGCRPALQDTEPRVPAQNWIIRVNVEHAAPLATGRWGLSRPPAGTYSLSHIPCQVSEQGSSLGCNTWAQDSPPTSHFQPLAHSLPQKLRHTCCPQVWDLLQCYSNCGPPTGSISIPWEFVRTANSWAPLPEAMNQKQGEAQQAVFLASPLGDSGAGSKIENH